MIFFNEKKIERFRTFFTMKIDFESQHFAIFDIFYSTERKTQKLFNGLVVGFGPKEKRGRMCNSVW